MKKRHVVCESIQIPFKDKFAHSSFIREETETIVVQIRNEENVIGLGESCPRSYVTGESIESAQSFITQIQSNFEEIKDLHDLIQLKTTHAENISKNPSAWCALEMAMLDLLAKEKGLSVEQLLGINPSPSSSSPSTATAVLGIDSFAKFLIKLLAYKTLGFEDFKIKLSGDKKSDLKKVKLISWFSSKIRVDANNLFKNSKEAIAYLEPFKNLIWAVEEPVSPNAFKEMKDIASAIKIKIILDESFLNMHSLEQIKGMNDIFIPNLRISKLGGVLATIELIKRLEQEEFFWIMGAHVGEMSLLTRASLIFTDHFSKNNLSHEGGFSTYLLKCDPFTPNLKIGRGAIIKGREKIEHAGLGMRFNKTKENK